MDVSGRGLTVHNRYIFLGQIKHVFLVVMKRFRSLNLFHALVPLVVDLPTV